MTFPHYKLKLEPIKQEPINCESCADRLNPDESIVYFKSKPYHLKCFREDVNDQIERKLCHDDGNPKPGASRLMFMWSEIESVIENRQMNNKEQVIIENVFKFNK